MITRSKARDGEADDSEDGDDELGEANVEEDDDGDECVPAGQCGWFIRALPLSERGRKECGSQRLSEFDYSKGEEKQNKAE